MVTKYWFYGYNPNGLPDGSMIETSTVNKSVDEILNEFRAEGYTNMNAVLFTNQSVAELNALLPPFKGFPSTTQSTSQQPTTQQTPIVTVNVGKPTGTSTTWILAAVAAIIAVVIIVWSVKK